jgi:hypothetical protein
MKEYLKDFDNRMRGRKVLLIDNFSAHELGVKLMEEAKLLKNTKVMWLLANATSIYQPLDQGIIQTWKTFVQKEWVMFMVKNFDNSKDFKAEMNVLKAI